MIQRHSLCAKPMLKLIVCFRRYLDVSSFDVVLFCVQHLEMVLMNSAYMFDQNATLAMDMQMNSRNCLSPNEWILSRILAINFFPKRLGWPLEYIEASH